VIRLNKPMPSNRELITFPAFNGHLPSAATRTTPWWSRRAGFKGSTFADATGAPQSDEICARSSASGRSARQQLEVMITVHDPEYYTRDWQGARFIYNLRNDLRIEDYLLRRRASRTFLRCLVLRRP